MRAFPHYGLSVPEVFLQGSGPVLQDNGVGYLPKYLNEYCDEVSLMGELDPVVCVR